MSSSPVIFTLPQELLQHIIIVSAFGAPPSTIAAITETCKFFYSLVYNSTDHHLWREIFLAIFDDPRPLLGYLTTLRGEQPVFDWEKEFKSPSYHPIHNLLSVLETCLPFAWTTTVAFGPLPSLGPEIPAKYPSFPPLIILLSSSICNASDKAQFSRVFESTSAQWLEDVLRDGFPRVLTRKLLASPSLLEAPHGDDTMSGGVDSSEASAEQELKEWTKSEEARLFYKLVAHTGFIPVRKPSRDVEASQTSGVGDDDPRNNQASDDGDTFFTPNSSTPASSVQITPLTPPAMPRGDASVDAQFASARRMARRTVYDLRFLKPERMFGPFLPSPPDEMADKQDGPTQKKRHGSQADSDDGSDDPDYVYPGTDSDEDDTESVNDDGEDLFPLINLISPQDTGAASADTRLPSPHTLMPDWIWLAGARIIVEANLRDMLRLTSAVDADLHDSDPSLDDVANALRRMEGLRMGGAPGFWDGWTAGSRVAVHANGEIDVKGKTKATEASEGSDQGWDWAGAAGTWKRCICWLDYRDLLINNLQFGTNRFNDDTLQEALRIFPMTLRVSRYSWPPAFNLTSSSSTCSAASQLPIIHVEGEMSGLDQEIARYLQGTISMIRDGVVRWSLQISSHSEESPGEWSTEGVQIGGVGSALGVLGLWTGADHERTDPLGPFWMWKVA